MPNNPLTPAELQSYINPTGVPQMPAGYFLASPVSGTGPFAYRLFDASYISIGIVDPNRLGTGSTGLGTRYLADDGTWKLVSSISGSTPTLAQVTTAGNTTTNSITVGGLTVDTNVLVVDSTNDRVGFGTTTPAYRIDVRGTLATDAIRTHIGYDIYPVPEPTSLTAVVSAGGSVDTGLHGYYITFITALGETRGYGPISVTTTAGNNTVTLTIPVSSDPRVTGRKIYRTKVGSIYNEYIIATINNNTATTYVDTAADSTLTLQYRGSYYRANTTAKQITISGQTSMLLDVNATYFGILAGASITSGGYNTFIGYSSGRLTTTGGSNEYIGYLAGYSNTTGSSSVVIGTTASYSATQIMDSVVIGQNAGRYHTGGTANITTLNQSVFIGMRSYAASATPSNTIVIGYLAESLGNNTVVLGNSSIVTTALRGNVLINTTTDAGFRLDVNGTARISGNLTVDTNTLFVDATNDRVGIGTTTPAYKIDVQGTTLVNSSVSVQGAFNIQPLAAPPAIGGFTLSAGTNLGVGQYYYFVTYVTAIGETNASSVLSVVTTTGNTTVNLTGIPVSSDPRVTARKLYRTKLGATSDNLWFLATITNNTATTYTDSATDASLTGVGLQAYKVNTTARYFTVSGTQGMVIDANLTAFGRNAGAAIISSNGASVRTVLVGADAGKSITTGQANVIVGVAGGSVTTGSSNTLMGDLAGYAVNTGSGNTIIGSQGGRYLTSGYNNIFIGPGAGSRLADGTTNVTTAFQNIVIGRNARFFTINDSNSIIIGDTALGLGTNTTVIGNSSTTFTSIPAGNMTVGGTTNAGFKLDVNGTTRIQSNLTVSSDIIVGTDNITNAWVAYTPIWSSQGGAQPNLGDGTITGFYKKIGKTVFVRVKLNFGLTTMGGDGAWLFSLPVNAASQDGIQFPCSMLDNGFAWYQGIVNGTYSGFTDKTAIIAQSPGGANSSQGVSGIFPFGWGNGDSLQFNGSYECV